FIVVGISSAVASLDHHVGGLQDRLSLESGRQAKLVDRVACDGSGDLAATFLTSLAGIGTYQVLQAVHGGTIAPQWILGAFLGAGGFAGSYCGARLQSRLPER